MSEQSQSNGPLGDRILIAVCFLLLGLPGLATLVVDKEQRHRDLLQRERRPLQTWLASTVVKNRTAWAEKAYSDRLGFRTALLKLRSFIHWEWLAQAPGPEVVRGKDDWLFLDNGRHLDNWRGAAPLDGDLVKEWVESFLFRQELAQEFGSRYIVCLLPSKASIYPEQLPERYKPVGPSRRDQVLEALRAAGVEAPDLLPIMLEAKTADSFEEWDFLVHPSGTHWSGRGEGVAERWLRKELGLEPVGAPWVRRPGKWGASDTWTTRMYLDGLAPFSQMEWRAKGSTDVGAGLRGKRLSRQWKNGERRFHMNGDSYGRGVRELLARDTWLRMAWEHSLDVGRMQTSKAEVVVDWFVERVLDDLDPIHFSAPLALDYGRVFAEGEPSGWSLGPDNPGSWRVLGQTEMHAQLEQSAEIQVEGQLGILLLEGLPDLNHACVLELDLTAPGFGGIEVGVASSPNGLGGRDTSRCATHRGGRQVLHIPVPSFKLKNGNRLQVLLDCGPGTYVLHGVQLRKVEALSGMGLGPR
jgi:hypothetical protein